MAFDVEAAKAAGYSDAEIASYLAEKQPQTDYMKPNPQGVVPAVERGTGLAARDMIEGLFGGPYDLIAKGINATGILPRINPLADNLTAWGFPKPETPGERGISAVQQPVASAAGTIATGGALKSPAFGPVTRSVGESLQTQPISQTIAAGTGGGVTEATGDPALGLAASVAAPFTGLGLRTLGKVAENAALGGISPADAQLGRLARDKYNIPIGAPDLSDNQLNRTVIDQAGKLPFAGARSAAADKQSAWQGAIAREMGEDATNFQPHVMERADTRIGKGLDDVAARTNIPPEQTAWLTDELDALSQRADRVLLGSEVTPLKNQIDDLKALIAKNDGHIDGETYQRLTRKGSDLSLLEKRNDNAGDFAGLVRDALDDALARSAAPGDVEALKTLRYQYRVMRTVDQLAAGSRGGDITPDGFMQKVLTASRRFDPPTAGMAYTGGGNIGELARIGKLMRAAPQTGTADRALVNLAVAGGVPALANISPTTAAGTAAVLAANRAAGSYLRSGSLANRLIENAIGPTVAGGSPYQAAQRTAELAAINQLLRN